MLHLATNPTSFTSTLKETTPPSPNLPTPSRPEQVHLSQYCLSGPPCNAPSTHLRLAVGAPKSAVLLLYSQCTSSILAPVRCRYLTCPSPTPACQCCMNLLSPQHNVLFMINLYLLGGGWGRARTWRRNRSWKVLRSQGLYMPTR